MLGDSVFEPGSPVYINGQLVGRIADLAERRFGLSWTAAEAVRELVTMAAVLGERMAADQGVRRDVVDNAEYDVNVPKRVVHGAG